MHGLHFRTGKTQTAVPVLFCLLSISSLLFSCPRDAEKTGAVLERRWVKHEHGIDLRAEPSLDAKAIGFLPPAQSVYILEERGAATTIQGTWGKWTKVAFQGREGWIFGGFLQEEDRWFKIYTPSTGYVTGSTLALTENDGYLVTGAAMDSADDSRKLCLTRKDRLGNDVWSRVYEDYVVSIHPVFIHAEYGDCFTIAFLAEMEPGPLGLILLKIDGSGNILRRNVYGRGHLSLNKLIKTRDENFLLLAGIERGEFLEKQYDNNEAASVIFKVHKDYGSVLFSRVFRNNEISRHQILYFGDALEDEEGNILACGIVEKTGKRGILFAKLDRRGDDIGLETWFKNDGAENVFRASCITPAGEYFFSGRSKIDGGDDYSAWLCKIDRNGDLLWEKTVAEKGSLWSFNEIFPEADGSIVLIGFFENNATQQTGILFLKIDKDGNELSRKKYSTYCFTYPECARRTDDGFIILGNHSETKPLHYITGNFILVKTDREGNTGGWPWQTD